MAPNERSIPSEIRYLAGYKMALGVVFALVILFFLLDANKYYQTETSFLVQSKASQAAGQEEIIAGNIAYIVGTFSFYEKIIRDNPAAFEGASQNSEESKRTIWKKTIKAEVVQGSIVKMRVNAGSQRESSLLAQKAGAALLNIAGQYYNAKTEAGFSIVDGPFTVARVGGILWIIPSSLVLGFVLALAIVTIFSAASRMLTREKIFSSRAPLIKKNFDWKDVRQAAQKIVPLGNISSAAFFARKKNEVENKPRIPFGYEQHHWQYDIKKIEAAKKELETSQQKHSAAIKNPEPKPEKINLAEAGVKKGEAPHNLPVFGGDKQVFPNDEEEAQIKREEEYKKKLNQLLRGEL